MTKQELEQCIHEYGKDIYSFCKQLAHNQQEADDLYQDTFLMAVEQRGKIDCAQNPKSYLLSVALRLWKNRKRKFAWRKRIADLRLSASRYEGEIDVIGDPDTVWITGSSSGRSRELSPEESVLGKEQVVEVRAAVNRLPEQLRITVLLYYMEELSTKQIAQVLQIPKGTVLSRLYQARKELQKELESIL